MYRYGMRWTIFPTAQNRLFEFHFRLGRWQIFNLLASRICLRLHGMRCNVPSKFNARIQVPEMRNHISKNY